MSAPEPDMPHDARGDDRAVVPATGARSTAGTCGSRVSEVERLRMQLAGMPDERWTRA